jgi:hypothetical protein
MDEVTGDGAPSTEEAEKKAGLDQISDKGKEKEVEVQVPAKKSAPEKSIRETQW